MLDAEVCVHVPSLDVKTESLTSECVVNGGTNEVVSPYFATRFIYNSSVNPAMVEAAFARRKPRVIPKISGIVPSKSFWSSMASGGNHVNVSPVVNVSNICSEVREECGSKSTGGAATKPVREYAGDSGNVVRGVNRQVHANNVDSSTNTPTTMDTLSDTYKH